MALAGEIDRRHKGHLANLDVQVSAFCDDTRDAVKGDLWSEDAAGFVNGGGLDAERLACCVKGWAGCTEGGAKAPSQTVNYLSSQRRSSSRRMRSISGTSIRPIRSNRKPSIWYSSAQ